MNAEIIEKVFNETFAPASEHDFLPITSETAHYINANQTTDDTSDGVGEKPLNCREIFFVHRSIAPDPEEVRYAFSYFY